MSDDESHFGCATCSPADAAEAWNARAGFAPVAVLVEESHYRVAIESCGSCGQRYVHVFCEMIDWVDGNDPQFRVLMPIDAAETERLLALGSDVDEATLAALGPRRRSLERDFGKDAAAPSVYWATGLHLAPHD